MTVARRFTIGRMMVAVLLVAVDFAVVRAVWGSAPWVGIAVTTLPTLNVLLLTIPSLRAGNPSRPFWAGFQAAGLLAAVALAGMIVADPNITLWPVERLWERLSAMVESRRRAVVITAAVLIYTTPLLLIGMAAGRLTARARVAAPRRRGG